MCPLLSDFTIVHPKLLLFSNFEGPTSRFILDVEYSINHLNDRNSVGSTFTKSRQNDVNGVTTSLNIQENNRTFWNLCIIRKQTGALCGFDVPTLYRDCGCIYASSGSTGIYVDT